MPRASNAPVPIHANGRPHGIAADQIDDLERAIRAGHFFKTACEMVGVNRHTFEDWLVKGGDPKSHDADKPTDPVEPYASFALRMRAAEAEGEDRALKAINGAFDRDWKSAAWFLSRKQPQQWAERQPGLQVATSGNVTFFLPDNGRDELPEGNPSDG